MLVLELFDLEGGNECGGGPSAEVALWRVQEECGIKNLVMWREVNRGDQFGRYASCGCLDCLGNVNLLLPVVEYGSCVGVQRLTDCFPRTRRE